MKNILIPSAFLSLSLLSLPGFTADLAAPESVAPTQVAVAAQELRPSPSEARAPLAQRATPVQFAAIGGLPQQGGMGSLQDAPLRTPGAVSEAVGGGLPSTPIALASLLLMICILIGRRKT